MADAGLTFRHVATVAATVALSACGAAKASPSPASSPMPMRLEPGASFSDRGWETLVSQRFLVALPLPDAAEWRVDDRSGRWLAAAHIPSKSMLWVRAWREGSVVSHGACEDEARRYRPDLLGRDASVLGDRRSLGAPAGFDTELAFSVSRNKDALGAVAAAFGARVRQCLVLIYATRADGPDAEELVADRVGFIVDSVFSRVETRTIDDRVAPETRTGR